MYIYQIKKNNKKYIKVFIYIYKILKTTGKNLFFV
uniref:Uncharacterized protein n=1 Tax=viral metagenome TaxID=1070528 RepID=A0A6C0F898_9ZZZZ